jgi:hypothetical protein
MPIIPHEEITFSKLSFMDPVGRLFFWKGDIYRGIYPKDAELIRELFTSGCLDELMQRELFPKSQITEHVLEGFSFIVKHEKIPYVVYPYEWTFDMYRDAALAILDVIDVSSKYGWDIHDGNAYNVLFRNMRPMYIDLGSFRKKPKRVGTDRDKRWGFDRGYEFLRDYWRPLYIWSRGDTFLALRIISSVMWPMPDLSWLLYQNPPMRWFGPKFSAWLTNRLDWWLRRIGRPVLHGRVLSWLSPSLASRLPAVVVAQNTKLLRLKISRLSQPLPDTWDDYYCEHMQDGKINSPPRFARILEIIRSLDCESVTELAGNQGVLARLILETTQVKKYVCTDYASSAINQFYLRNRKDASFLKDRMVQAAVLNPMMPEVAARLSPPSERLKSDLIIALAVTHHLLLPQHYHVKEVLKTMADFTRRFIIVEFMPLGLWRGEEVPPPVPDWYTTEWFQQAFVEFFELIAVEELERNRIVFVGRLKA